MLVLFTPLPEADTGTAAYASALLDELVAQAGAAIREQTVVAIDGSACERQGLNARLAGWKVQDFRSLATTSDDVCVYFLASNPYHRYCYEQLALHCRGRALGVIHDLSAAHMIRDMTRSSGSPYAGSLGKVFQHDFVCQSTPPHWYYDQLHWVSRHFVTGQGLTLEKCSGVIVHSYYAKAKLLLDAGSGGSLAQKIKVCAHPSPRIAPRFGSGRPASCASGERYRVGSLGYYLRMKRFHSIVSAWSRFQAGHDGLAPGELLLGGDVTKRERRRLLRLCDRRFRHTMRFTGFLTEDELHRAIQSLDLAIALRFPSNGETSGIVAHCLAYRTPIAVSQFAAFREEPAAFRIPVAPESEVEELAAALNEGFRAWQRGVRLHNEPAEWVGRKAPISRCLLEALDS